MKKLLPIILFFLSFQSLTAQVLEPKLYANTPIDVNVLFIAYGHTQGAIPTNQALEIEDPHLKYLPL